MSIRLASIGLSAAIGCALIASEAVSHGAATSRRTVASRNRAPRYPDAVTRPPLWLIENAPFDVRVYLQSLPPSENAAPLYLEALFEFNSSLAVCFTDSQVLRRRRAAIDRRRDRLSNVHEAWAEGRTRSDGDVDAMLAEYTPALRKLRAAQQRSRCCFEVGLALDSTQQHGSMISTTVNLFLEMVTSRAVDKGNLDQAVEMIEIALRLSRDLRGRGNLLTQMQSMRLDSLIARKMVPRVLQASGMRVLHYDRMLRAIDLHMTRTLDPLTELARVDYLIARTTLHDLRYRTGPFAAKSQLAGPTLCEWLFGYRDDDRFYPPAAIARFVDFQLLAGRRADDEREVATLADYYRALLALPRDPDDRVPKVVEAFDHVPGKQLDEFLSKHENWVGVSVDQMPPEGKRAFMEYPLARVIIAGQHPWHRRTAEMDRLNIERWRALRRIVERSKSGESFVSAVSDLLSDPDLLARFIAANLLAEVAPQTPGIVPILKEVLARETGLIRSNALGILRRIAPGEVPEADLAK